jgi:hypothetical protein
VLDDIKSVPRDGKIETKEMSKIPRKRHKHGIEKKNYIIIFIQEFGHDKIRNLIYLVKLSD